VTQTRRIKHLVTVNAVEHDAIVIFRKGCAPLAVYLAIQFCDRCPKMRLHQLLNLGGAVSCSLGGILALISLLKGREARHLSSATYIESLAELKAVLAAAPILIAVAGRVWGPKPLKCELSEGEGVIVHLREDKKVETRTTPSLWLTESEPLRSVVRETVDWALVDGSGSSTAQLPVLDGRHAGGDYLQMSGEVFIPSDSGVLESVLSQLAGHKALGLQRSERYLPVGTALTAVGELSLAIDTPGVFKHAFRSGGRMYVLRAPQNGPFVLSRRRFPELLASTQSTSQVCGTFAVYFAVVGVGFFCVSAAMRAWVRHRVRKMQRRVAEARRRRREATGARDRQGSNSSASASGPTSQSRWTSTGGENDVVSNESESDSRLPGLCVVCLQRDCEMCFPCGHLCCCRACGSERALTRCPVCRARGRPMRVYLT
jgi:hypothetical protein